MRGRGSGLADIRSARSTKPAASAVFASIVSPVRASHVPISPGSRENSNSIPTSSHSPMPTSGIAIAEVGGGHAGGPVHAQSQSAPHRPPCRWVVTGLPNWATTASIAYSSAGNSSADCTPFSIIVGASSAHRRHRHQQARPSPLMSRACADASSRRGAQLFGDHGDHLGRQGIERRGAHQPQVAGALTHLELHITIGHWRLLISWRPEQPLHARGQIRLIGEAIAPAGVRPAAGPAGSTSGCRPPSRGRASTPMLFPLFWGPCALIFLPRPRGPI